MRVVVDYDLCESNALCMAAAPEVFEVRDDDFLYVLQEEPPEELREKVDRYRTTDPRDLLVGLERLRVPIQLVQIMGFMVRYLDVVTDELRRMRTARESRGFTARDPRQWPVVARSAGALFIRSFERGERVHLAMISRGYDGTAQHGARR